MNFEKRNAAGCLRIAIIAISLFGVSAKSNADYTAVVNPASVLATNFEGWGTSLCWWANVVGAYSNRNDYANLAFSQLKLNIVRYNIGGGENPSLTGTITAYRANMQGFEPTNGVWNWNADANQRWVLQAALARGANLVDAFANSPPWWMTVSGSVTGAVGGTNNLQAGYENAFATYLANVVSNLTVRDSVHFDFVTPLNEPSDAWTYANGKQEGCHVSTSQQPGIINDLRAALNSALPSAGIDGPEDFDEYESYNDLVSYSTTTLGNLALFTTHTYKANDPTNLRNEAVAQHKPLWVAEYGDGDGTGLTMAQRIHDDITGMGVRAWVYWQVVDNAGGWGFLYNPLTTNSSGGFTTNYTINEKFYVIGQFSEFIRPGCEIISVNDTNTLAAYNSTNSTLVLVMVNTNTTSFNVTYDLSAFGSVPWQAAVVRTSPGESLASLPALPVTNQKFTSAIPAQSVTTFLLTTNITFPMIISQVPVPNTNVLALYAGQTPTFSVSAVGSLPLYYQWRSNSVAMAGATNASYTPAAAQLSSLTNLDCIVSNSVGSVTSRVWSVSVVPAPTASYPQAVLALNPAGYWRLNETPDNGNGDQGAICHDFVGGNNGIYANVVLGQSGYNPVADPADSSTKFGTFLPTNCAAGQIAGVDFGLPAGSNAEFSVAAWANGAGYKQNLNAGLVTKGYFYGEELDLDEGAPGGNFRFEVRSAAGTAYNANSSINAYTNGGWHHLVGVCDEANSSVLLYVDGVLNGSAAIPALSGIINSASVPMTIGARAQSATSGNNQQFYGWINDVALYKYALNSNQVKVLYQAGIALPPPSLKITNLGGNQVELNWNYGSLQSASSIEGPYSDVAGAPRPYSIPMTNAQQFYRIRGTN